MLSNIKNLDTVYVIAEIGLNHNGDIEIAKQLISEGIHFLFNTKLVKFCSSEQTVILKNNLNR